METAMPLPFARTDPKEQRALVWWHHLGSNEREQILTTMAGSLRFRESKDRNYDAYDEDTNAVAVASVLQSLLLPRETGTRMLHDLLRFNESINDPRSDEMSTKLNASTWPRDDYFFEALWKMGLRPRNEDDSGRNFVRARRGLIDISFIISSIGEYFTFMLMLASSDSRTPGNGGPLPDKLTAFVGQRDAARERGNAAVRAGDYAAALSDYGVALQRDKRDPRAQ
jgi:hypothetical protein